MKVGLRLFFICFDGGVEDGAEVGCRCTIGGSSEHNGT